MRRVRARPSCLCPQSVLCYLSGLGGEGKGQAVLPLSTECVTCQVWVGRVRAKPSCLCLQSVLWSGLGGEGKGQAVLPLSIECVVLPVRSGWGG